MGQEIVYCFKCQNRLLGSDFEKGKAFRVDSQAACPNCVRELLAHLPDPDAELERLKRAQVPKPPGSGSTTKMPALRMDSTSRNLVAPPRSAAPEPPPPQKSQMPMIVGGVVGATALLILIAFAFSGNTEHRRPPDPAPIPVPPDPTPRPDPKPTPPPVDRVARDLEELDARCSQLIRQEKLPEVARMYADARGKHSSIDWSRGLDERLQKLEVVARRTAAPLLEQVGPAVRKGDQAGLKDIRSRIEALGIPALLPDYERAIAAAKEDPWVPLEVQVSASEGGAVMTRQPDGSVLVSGNNNAQDTLLMSARVGLKQVRGFRLEALPHASLPGSGPGRATNGNFVMSEFRVQAGGKPLVFSGASGTYEQERYPTSAAIDGNPLTGWAVSGRLGQFSAAYFHLAAPADLDSITIFLDHRSVHPNHVLGCFRISTSIVELPAPPAPRAAEAYQEKPPAALEISPAIVAYRKRWEAVGRLAAARDFAGAVKSLEEARAGLTDDALRKEAEADVADFKLCAEALAEVPKLLPRWTKGSKIALEFIASGGLSERYDGTVVDVTARGVSVLGDQGTLDVPAGELAASSIAALMALRGEKKPTDARVAAVLAGLEGRMDASVPARFGTLRGAIDPREAEARRVFWLTEEDYAAMRTRGAAGGAYEKLIQEATAFSARNKPFLEERIAGTRDLFFFADDLTAAGTFAMATSPKMESFWVSSADSPGNRAAGNYLETEVFIAPGATYRAWVYVGGCCQEVFTFYLQGTGLTGPSPKNPKETVTATPGGEVWAGVKPPSLSLKKKHSDHTGPKEPDRWTWMDLGPLAFSEPGPKKFRILTDQKGFAVAYLAISAVRPTQPRDSDVKDLLRNRPAPSFGPTGAILREIYRDINGDSVGELTGNAKFKEGKPDESGPISAIDSWNMGNAYGCRIRGYVHPPTSGEYTFWVSSDDHSELWLSTDDTPAKKVKLCSLNHAVGQRDFNSDPSQKSAPVALVGGKRYYIEVLQKQGGGGEHVSAGWTLPDGKEERPIPPTRLSPVGALPMRRAVRPVFKILNPEGSLVKSVSVGGQGGAPWEHAPSPRLFLRGLKYGLAPSGCLQSLKPLYIGAAGESEGPQNGGGTLDHDVVARPGYAVGGMIARGTDRLNTFKLVFMRISGARLLPSDRYESEWIGTRAEGAEVRIGDDGTPVLGIFGKAGSEIDCAGLILQGK